LDVHEVFDITAGDLQRLAAATGRQQHWPGLGVYTSDLAYAASIEETAEKVVDGSYCASLGSLHVEIALNNRVNHPARELQENHCLEEVQKQRLRQYARADAHALEEFPIESVMRDLLAQVRPYRADSIGAAKIQVTRSVHKKIEELLNKIEDYRAKLIQKINAPEKIDRLRREVETEANCRLAP